MIKARGSVLFLLGFAFAMGFCSSASRGVIILCAGDSLTEKGYPPFLKRLLTQEGIRVRVLNHGRSGFTSAEYLRFLKQNESSLAESQPDFVLLQLGTNDVRVDGDFTPTEEFVANMKKILSLFRQFRTRRGEKPKILLATIPPVPRGSPFPFSPESEKRVKEEINPAIERLSKEEMILMVDNYRLFLNAPHLLPEVHPTEEGYRRMAWNWFQAMKPYLSDD